MTYYAGQTTFGRDSFDDFGRSVSSAGDINGDGIVDYVVSAPNEIDFGVPYAQRTEGAAYVIFGTEMGPATVDLNTLDGTNGFRLVASNQTNNRPNDMGDIVASLGDVNGDGFDDLLIGGREGNYEGYDQPFERENFLYVVFGRDAAVDGAFASEIDLATAPASEVAAITGVDGFLTTAGGLGDFNGDGFNDIVIGQSPVPQTIGGFFGVLDAPVVSQVAPGGEYNGFVIFGGTGLGATGEIAITDLDGTNGFGIAGPRGQAPGGVEGGATQTFGGFSLNLGDINGDGLSDIFVQNVEGTLLDDNGTPYDPYDDQFEFTTSQYILFGGTLPTGDVLDPAVDGVAVDWANLEFDTPFFGFRPPTVASQTDPQGFTGRFNSYAIAGIGDVNGDGFDDVAIGQSNLLSVGDPNDPDFQEFFTGPVHVLYGGAGGVDTDETDGTINGVPVSVFVDGPTEAGAGFTLFDSSDNGNFGAVLSGAGDVNGDGIGDFLIGSPLASNSDFNDFINEGEVHLVLGRDVANGDPAFNPLIDVSNLDATEASGIYRFTLGTDGQLGAALSAAGDVNNDGIDDFLLGAPETDAAGESSAGAAYLVLGGLANLEAADNADGSDDNVIDVANLDVDVDTGLVPIDVELLDGFGFLEQNEGDIGTTNFNFTVSRTGDFNVGLTLDFAVTGSGIRPADATDFGGTLPSGQVTFAAGEATATISVPVSGDLDIEANEDFQLTISNPVVSGVPIAPPVNIIDGVGFGRIRNDEFPPEIRVASSVASVVEGDPTDPDVPRTITFTIERLGDSVAATGEVEVIYELTPGDNTFRPLLNADDADVVGGLSNGPQSVIIPAGASSVDVVVEISPDTAQEPREQFNFDILDIVDPNNVGYELTRTSATGFITNDDGRPVVIPDGGEADVYGDPHIVSLDGLGYDFQAVGEYILVETNDPAATNPFQVQVRFEPLEDSELVSVTTKMAVVIGGSTVEIDARGPDELLIDGVAVDVLGGASTDLDGDGLNDVLFDGDMYTVVLNTTDNGQNELLTVKVMDGLMNICVFLSNDAGGNANNVQGLMGNNDGDLSNDFQLRDGSVIPTTELTFDTSGPVPVPALSFDFLYGRGAFDGAGYAGSWSVDTAERLFSDTAPAFPDNFPVGVVTIDDLPADVVAAATQAAIDAGLDPTEAAIFESAVLDFALTGDGDFLTGALGLAAEPEANTAPPEDTAPVLPTSYAVTPELAEVFEGDAGDQTTVNFQLFRFGDVLDAATVDLSFGGDAAADAAAGESLLQTVSFAAGEMSTVVSLTLNGDNIDEPDEELVLTIEDVSDLDAIIAGASAETTILDDDDPVVANEPPVAVDDTATTDEDVGVSIDLLANDSDPEMDALTVTLTSSATAGAIIDLGGGSVQYDPNLNFFGEDTFTYTVSDGNGNVSNEATVTITVDPVNDPVLFTAPGAQTTDEDMALSVSGFSLSDVDGGDTITATFSVSNGALSVVASGAAGVVGDGTGSLEVMGSAEDVDLTIQGLTYTPNANFNGPDEIIAEFSDGTFSTGEFGTSITVDPVNDAPTASPVEAAFNSDAPVLEIDLLDGASDADGDDLDISDLTFVGLTPLFLQDEEEGTLTLDAGQFDALAPGELQIITATYNVTDGAEDTPNTVTVTITGAPDAPDGITVDTALDVVDDADGLTSLREAIALANETAGADVINILVPGGDPAIILTGGAFEVTDDLTINGNGTTIDAGGASRIFEMPNDVSLSLDSMTLTNGRVTGREDGGAIAGRNGNTLTLTDVDVTNNQAEDDGGAIFLLDDATFSMTGGSLSGNSGDLGGAIFIDDTSSAEFNGVLIEGNTGRFGGALRIDQDAVVTLTETSVVLNSATANGGVIWANDRLVLTMVDTDIDTNVVSSAGRGGAIRADDDALIEITSSALVANEAGRGGAIAVGDGAAISITDATLAANTATRFGGGIYMEDDGQVTFSGASVTQNDAGRLGGAVYGDDNAAVTIEDNTEIAGNFATREGGAVFVDQDGVIQVTNSLVAQNSAGQGGAFALDDNGMVTITDSILDDNEAFGAGGDGGAIYVDNGVAQITLTGTSASGNSATDGGLIGTEGSNGAALVISITSDGSDSLTGNSASEDGGLISADSDAVIFVRGVGIDGNTAGGDGGVFFVDDFAIIDATFTDGGTNTATGTGDILSADDSLDATINGTVLTGDDLFL